MCVECVYSDKFLDKFFFLDKFKHNYQVTFVTYNNT